MTSSFLWLGSYTMESMRDFLLRVMLREPISSFSLGRTGGFTKRGKAPLSGPCTLFLIYCGYFLILGKS